MYELYISYLVKNMTCLRETDSALVEILGHSESAGFDFGGIREHSWYFETRPAAFSALAKIKPHVKKLGLVVTVEERL